MKERDRIKAKFGGRCAYCGEVLPDKGWHVDHAEPVGRIFKRNPDYMEHSITGKKISIDEYMCSQTSREERPREAGYWSRKSGKLVVTGFNKPENDNYENKIPSCSSCNINKHGMNIEQFRRFIEKFVVSLNRDSVVYRVAKRYGLIQETGKKVIFYFETLNTTK